MNPLRVALVHYKKRSGCGGRWAYKVPEFEVTRYALDKYQSLNVGGFGEKYDVIIQEDRRLRTKYVGQCSIPKLYHVRGGTCRWPHSYWHRRRLAKSFDGVLVDTLPLSFFEDLGIPVLRFNYCVNDQIYRDYKLKKDIDVSCHMRFDSKRRKRLAQRLERLCLSRHYSYSIQRVSPYTEYAKAFNRSKVTVNLAKPRDRNYRLFDAMACRTCVLTTPMPRVSGERRNSGEHYYEWHDTGELFELIDQLMQSGEWEQTSSLAYDLVNESHTWSTRARELRQGLSEAFRI